MAVKTVVTSNFAQALNPILGTNLIDVPETASAEETQRMNGRNAAELERAIDSIMTLPFAPMRSEKDKNLLGDWRTQDGFAQAFVDSGGPWAIIGPVQHPALAPICWIPFLFLPRGYRDAVTLAKEKTGYRYAYIAQAGTPRLCTYPNKYRDGEIVKPGDPWFDWWANKAVPTMDWQRCDQFGWQVLKWIVVVQGPVLPCAPADTLCQRFSPLPGQNPTAKVKRPEWQTAQIIIYKPSSPPYSPPNGRECPGGYTGIPPHCIPVTAPPGQCPAGYVGTPPNCVPVAPPGDLEDVFKKKEFLIFAGLILAGLVLLAGD